jgi:hypothetical protein
VIFYDLFLPLICHTINQHWILIWHLRFGHYLLAPALASPACPIKKTSRSITYYLITLLRCINIVMPSGSSRISAAAAVIHQPPLEPPPPPARPPPEKSRSTSTRPTGLCQPPTDLHTWGHLAHHPFALPWLWLPLPPSAPPPSGQLLLRLPFLRLHGFRRPRFPFTYQKQAPPSRSLCIDLCFFASYFGGWSGPRACHCECYLASFRVRRFYNLCFFWWDTRFGKRLLLVS